MTTQTRMTLDEFLALPEEKPYREFLKGEVYDKVAPDAIHASAVVEIVGDLRDHVRGGALPFKVLSEGRHANRAEDWTYLPDVNVTHLDRLPADWWRRHQGPILVTPDFAIEVLSPDDSATYQLQRVELYLNSGVRLLWLIDPAAETVSVYKPGQPVHVHRAPGVIDAAPVLTEFRLDLGDYFDRVYERKR